MTFRATGYNDNLALDVPVFTYCKRALDGYNYSRNIKSQSFSVHGDAL